MGRGLDHDRAWAILTLDDDEFSAPAAIAGPRILVGDCRDRLRELPDESVQTVVTSPPYFGLRDYGTGAWDGGDAECDHAVISDAGATSQRAGRTYQQSHPRQVCRCGAVRRLDWVGGDAECDHMAPPTGGRQKGPTLVGTSNRDGYSADGQFRVLCGKCGARRVHLQMGQEPTPDDFVASLVDVFREVRRVLRADGTVWLNLGDSYASGGPIDPYRRTTSGKLMPPQGRSPIGPGLKSKDLIGVPWLVAFALRADGWYLRADVIWAKPNPMPESVKDRPTRAHEFVFLLSKSPRYFYDADAIRDPLEGTPHAPGNLKLDASRNDGDRMSAVWGFAHGRNKRDVWTVTTQPFRDAHFAVFPARLIEPMILAGSSPTACGECGAPWRRVVELVGGQTTGRTPGQMAYNAERGIRNASYASILGSVVAQHVTRGWEPTCDHDDDTGQCVVLDPFAGSGTTGVVAGQLGRAFIGCELSESYAEMARRRIIVEGRPGDRRHEPADPIPGQLRLVEA